jgi:hypothetical protein
VVAVIVNVAMIWREKCVRVQTVSCKAVGTVDVVTVCVCVCVCVYVCVCVCVREGAAQTGVA